MTGTITANPIMTTILYNLDFPQGKTFKNNDVDFKKLESEGWVDCPTKVEETPKPKRTRKVKDDSEKDN